MAFLSNVDCFVIECVVMIVEYNTSIQRHIHTTARRNLVMLGNGCVKLIAMACPRNEIFFLVISISTVTTES